NDQSFDDSADESTLCTPFTDLATATDFCTCAFVSTTPDSVTMPFLVVTLMSFDEMPLVVASSAFTFVVIHVSVPGCDDFSGDVDMSSAPTTRPEEPRPSAPRCVFLKNVFITSPLSMNPAPPRPRAAARGRVIYKRRPIAGPAVSAFSASRRVQFAIGRR